MKSLYINISLLVAIIVTIVISCTEKQDFKTSDNKQAQIHRIVNDTTICVAEGDNIIIEEEVWDSVLTWYYYNRWTIDVQFDTFLLDLDEDIPFIALVGQDIETGESACLYLQLNYDSGSNEYLMCNGGEKHTCKGVNCSGCTFADESCFCTGSKIDPAKDYYGCEHTVTTGGNFWKNAAAVGGVIWSIISFFL